MVVVKCCERGVAVVWRRVVGGTCGVVGRRVVVVKVVLTDFADAAALVKLVLEVNLVWAELVVNWVLADASLLAPPRTPDLGLPFWDRISKGIFSRGSKKS